MTWEPYFINPIDFGWEMLPTVEDVAAQLARVEAADLVANQGNADSTVPKFLSDFQAAHKLALEAGWEGDYRPGHEPRVFWLPVEGSFIYGFAWKQDNNGDTLVIAPRPLDWLNELTLR